MSDAPTRILLIRHGTNDCAQQRLLAGRTPGVHLNEEGRAQAESLAQRLSMAQLAAVYSSPLERTKETAAPLAERLGLMVEFLDEVLESDCGRWTGQSLDELSKTATWQQAQAHPSCFRFPGGESMAEIQARMVAAMDVLLARHPGQTIAVVSHSDPIRLAIAYYAGIPLDLFQRLVVAPASVSELEFTQLRSRLVRLNDCAHCPPNTHEREQRP